MPISSALFFSNFNVLCICFLEVARITVSSISRRVWILPNQPSDPLIATASIIDSMKKVKSGQLGLAPWWTPAIALKDSLPIVPDDFSMHAANACRKPFRSKCLNNFHSLLCHKLFDSQWMQCKLCIYFYGQCLSLSHRMIFRCEWSYFCIFILIDNAVFRAQSFCFLVCGVNLEIICVGPKHPLMLPHLITKLGTTYTKMCRLLLIHKMLVSSYHIRAHLWCHNIPNHCDVTSSSVTSSCPLFAAGVVMTPFIVDVTNNKMLMVTYGRSLHCGDLHCDIPWYNILVLLHPYDV